MNCDLDKTERRWILRALVLPAWMAGWGAWGNALPCRADEPTPITEDSNRIPRDAVAEAELIAAAGPGFILHRTDHFLICGRSDGRVLDEFVSRIEATYDRVYEFCDRLAIPASRPDRLLQVIFFDTHSEFCRYARREGSACTNLTGFFYTKSNRAVFYDIIDDPGLAQFHRRIADAEQRLDRASAARHRRPGSGRSRRDSSNLRAARAELEQLRRQRDTEVERLNRLTVQHEVAHQVFYNAGVHTSGARNPGWLVEGLACLFESDNGTDGEGSGSLNSLRLRDLMAALTPGASATRRPSHDALARAIRSRRLLPLVDLVQDAQLFTRRDQPHLVNYYAQAWSLAYFLQRFHNQSFGEYIRLISQRSVGDETSPQRELSDFVSVFGPLDQRFEKRWADFVIGLAS